MSLDEITLVHVRMGVLGPIVAVDVSFDMGVRCTHALFPFVSRCVEVAPNGRTSASSR